MTARHTQWQPALVRTPRCVESKRVPAAAHAEQPPRLVQLCQTARVPDALLCWRDGGVRLMRYAVGFVRVGARAHAGGVTCVASDPAAAAACDSAAKAVTAGDAPSLAHERGAGDLAEKHP